VFKKEDEGELKKTLVVQAAAMSDEQLAACPCTHTHVVPYGCRERRSLSSCTTLQSRLVIIEIRTAGGREVSEVRGTVSRIP
jgi:hypothetical protein